MSARTGRFPRAPMYLPPVANATCDEAGVDDVLACLGCSAHHREERHRGDAPVCAMCLRRHADHVVAELDARRPVERRAGATSAAPRNPQRASVSS